MCFWPGSNLTILSRLESFFQRPLQEEIQRIHINPAAFGIIKKGVQRHLGLLADEVVVRAEGK